MRATREQMIAHLVTVASQWGIKTSTGKPYTAETFAQATTEWLRKQTKELKSSGKKLAATQN